MIFWVRDKVYSSENEVLGVRMSENEKKQFSAGIGRHLYVSCPRNSKQRDLDIALAMIKKHIAEFENRIIV